MNDFEQVTQQIALTLGVSWAAGINLYAAVATLGLLGSTGHMQLPPGLEVLANPLVIGAAALMYAVEFFADKIPGVDSAWDVLHTFIRIPAGAALAAGTVGSSFGKLDPAVAVAAGILGGTVAGGMHFAKAGTRLLINTSPEPFSNSIASVAEDATVFGGLWMMHSHPNWFLALLAAVFTAVGLLLPKLWKGAKALMARVANFLRGRGLREAAVPAAATAGAGPATAKKATPVDEDQTPVL